MEDPKEAKGVVKREVVQVITPGTVVDSTKPDSENNFLVALDRSGNEYGLAYMDLVTGEFQVTTSMTLAWFVEKSAIYVRVRWSWVMPCQNRKSVCLLAR